MENFCLAILSDDHQTKQIPKILYDELNINDKELLNKLTKYEVIHPEDVAPVANEFPEFYGKVNITSCSIYWVYRDHFVSFLSGCSIL